MHCFIGLAEGRLIGHNNIYIKCMHRQSITITQEFILNICGLHIFLLYFLSYIYTIMAAPVIFIFQKISIYRVCLSDCFVFISSSDVLLMQLRVSCIFLFILAILSILY